MFDDNDLKLLNSSKALEYLLKHDQPDFAEIVAQLRYEKELVKLQTELIKMQNWVVEEGERLLVILEGREFAGKGGAIRIFTEHLNPRSIRQVALQKPTERQKGQWYFKRYVEQLPEKGEIVFFDRSWYNRAMVEPVNGFCTKEEYKRFMKEVPHFEKMLLGDGIRIIKFYLSISKEEQRRRIEEVKYNPLRRWELTPVDLAAQGLWDTYTAYKKKMLKKTNLPNSPWIVIEADNKRKAYLEASCKLLDAVPYRKEAPAPCQD